MTDRELLEFAAKAGAVAIEWGIVEGGKEIAPKSHAYCRDTVGIRWRWNPLEDDGDAFRLAMKLRMCVDAVQGADTVQYFHSGLAQVLHSEIDITADDYQAATRRAIVRAAAEIGKALP